MQRLHSLRRCLSTLFIICISLPAQDSGKPAVVNEQVTVVRAGAVSITIPSPSADMVEAGSDWRGRRAG